jgi:hypothetical protein
MTLQQHFNLITEGKGNKAQFLKQARLLFPEYFNQYTDFDTATNVLKSKQIISEAAGGVVAKGFNIWDWKKILAEETKATEKETSKEVLDDQKHAYNNSDMKDADNVNFNEIMKGFFAEMYDEKNKEKTGDEIKAMVVKNLAKDCLYYTKNGNFSTMGVGYTDEAPGLGQPKEPKGKHKSSGYGDLKENKEKRKLSLKLVDGKDKKGLALYKNTEDQNDLYYYDGKVLYSVVDGDKKGPSVRMSLYNINGLQENKELDQYADMSDQEIIQWAYSDGFEDFIVYDGEDGLANREEVLKALLGIEESVTEQKLRSLIRNLINEELNSSEYKNTLMDMEKPHYNDPEALDQIVKIYSSHIQSLNSIKNRNK